MARAKMMQGSEIRTDGWQAYRVIGVDGFEPRYVVLMKDKEGFD